MQYLQELLRLQLWLEDIVRDTALERGTHILEFPKAAQHDHLHLRVAGFQHSSQFLPVHHRHDDIRNDDMRRQRSHHLQRFLAVCGLADNAEPMRLPFQMVLDPLTHQQFIINNHYPAELAHVFIPPGSNQVPFGMLAFTQKSKTVVSRRFASLQIQLVIHRILRFFKPFLKI
ncbi:hypothetical protein D3C81_1247550 [compost metagenome]